MTDVKQRKSRFPFWLVCILVLLCSPIVGGVGSSLSVRVLKGGRRWREIPPPSGEKVVALLDATITSFKEHRLCVRTERGGIYLWRKSYRSWGRLDPGGPLSDQYWHLLKPLPDGEATKQLVISDSDSDDEWPLVVVKSENGRAYGWQNDNWHPLEKTSEFDTYWPHIWPSDTETKSGSIILTNNILSTGHASISGGESRPRREFHPWFALPRPPGKVIDEVRISFEGSLSYCVSSYVLLEDNRLLVLATEVDFIDGVIWLAGATIAFLVGVTLLIVLGVRRKRAGARSLETATS